jgi:hypothetical protein
MMDENAQLSPPSSPHIVPARRGSSLRISFWDWIPAFAGMTVERWWRTNELCGPAHLQKQVDWLALGADRLPRICRKRKFSRRIELS